MPKARSSDADPPPKPARPSGSGKAAAPSAAQPKRPKVGKAGRPDVVPLDEHLAALLNPALNEGRRSAAVPDRSAPCRSADGFAEAPQAPFDAAEPIAAGTLVRRHPAKAERPKRRPPNIRAASAGQRPRPKCSSSSSSPATRA